MNLKVLLLFTTLAISVPSIRGEDNDNNLDLTDEEMDKFFNANFQRFLTFLSRTVFEDGQVWQDWLPTFQQWLEKQREKGGKGGFEREYSFASSTRPVLAHGWSFY